MTYVTRIIGTATLLTGLGFFGYTTAAAQASTHAQAPTSNVRSTPSTSSSRSHVSEPKVTSFRGIAAKLNTTPEVLESAYKTALATNPKLTRGRFVAANVLAQNLGSKNPSITTQAILDGLKSGKSVGQTLQSLGLSAKEADQAQDQANREIRKAGQSSSTRTPKDSTK